MLGAGGHLWALGVAAAVVRSLHGMAFSSAVLDFMKPDVLRHP